MMRPVRISSSRFKAFVILAACSTFIVISIYLFSGYINAMEANSNYLELGFKKIMILSTRGNQARRHYMNKLLGHHSITHVFYPALDSSDLMHPGMYRRWLGEEEWEWPNTDTGDLEELARFRSHMNVINEVIRLKYESALILEDNVDIELTIKQTMRTVMQNIPNTWEVLYLGSCNNETARPSGISSDIFVSDRPGCSFAYAVSRRGAIRLKRVLDNMWPDPDRSFDAQMDEMARRMYIEAYSVIPPLVAQLYSNAGAFKVTHILQNSTLSRIGKA